ncbi:MAG: AAA family ATPase [Vicinamibacterales bacterium]
MTRISDALRKAQQQEEALRRGTEADAPARADGAAHEEAASPWPIDDETVEQTRQAASTRREPEAERPRGDDGWELATGRSDEGLVVSRTALAGRRPARPAHPTRDLVRYGDMLRRRWLTGVAILVVVTAGITIGVLRQTPTYRAAGLLEIRREATGTAQVQTLFASERVSTDDLETQFGILRSGTLARRVVAQLSPTVPVGIRRSEARDLTADKLQRTLRITPKTGSRLVEVSYESTNPALSAWVVNAVLDTYLQLRQEEATTSAEWLDRQLAAARQQLENSEDRLRTFLHSHGLDVIETGKGETVQVVNQRIQTLHDSLADAQAERIEKQSSAEQAAQHAGSTDLDSPVLQSLNVRVADLRREHARLSAAFHDEYPAVKAVASQIAEMERAIERESKLVVQRADREFQSARRREALIQQVLDQENAVVQALGQAPSSPGGYESLKREVVTNQAQYAALDQKLKDVSISAALKAANVGVVDRASATPEGPGASLPLAIGLAGMVGLVLGVGGMFLQEHLDTSMRSVEDVEGYLGLPTLAAIPGRFGTSRLRFRPGADAAPAHNWRLIDQHGRDTSALAEAFAALRTAVLLRDDASGPLTLLVTSATGGEGKTTVAVNLAMSLARLNHRVLLIDANLRSPSVHFAFDAPGDKNLVDVLAHGAHWQGCVQKVQPNLDMLAAGTADMSPADLLSLPQMPQLVVHAAEEYDFVLFDSPALLAHPADVHALASLADSVLLTVRQGHTPREAVAQALSQLDRVSGVVLNGFQAPRAGGRSRAFVEVA